MPTAAILGRDAGYNFMAKVQEGEKKARAYNALRQSYGDIAGDPETATALDSLQRTQQLHPGALEAQGIANARNQQVTDFAAQAQPGALREQELANTDTAQEAKRLAMLRAAIYVKSKLDSDVAGNVDIGGVFDQVAPVFGLSPEAQAASKAEFMQNPQSVSAIIEALQTQGKQGAASSRWQVVQDENGKLSRVDAAGNAEPVIGADGRQVVGYQAVQGAARIGESAANRASRDDPALRGSVAGAEAKSRALGKAEGEKTASDLPLSKTELAKAQAGRKDEEAKLDFSLRELAKARGEVTKLSSGIAAKLPLNVYATNLKERLSSVVSKITFDQVAAMKRLSTNGSTSLGALSDTEGARLAAMRGSLNVEQGPEQLRGMVDNVIAESQASWARFVEAYDADLAARGQSAAPSSDGWKIEAE